MMKQKNDKQAIDIANVDAPLLQAGRQVDWAGRLWEK